MLNISNNKVKIQTKGKGALRYITNPKPAKRLAYILSGMLGIFIIIMFLPWTQNIRARGKLTTLTPEDRPQELQSRIDGRVEKWYVKEGDTVKMGDTIVFISEIKDQYFDPQLLRRTQEQLEAKESMGMAYQQKISTLENQVMAEQNNLRLKLKQARNKVEISRRKVTIDSADVVQAKTAYKIATDQLNRGEKMYKEQGIIALKDLEDRRNKQQETGAKLVSAENKYENSQRELINSVLDLNTIEAEYLSKIFKIESEIQSANSELFKTDEDIAKLNNQYTNYSIRSRYWHITAPRDGQIVKIMKSGIGENVAAGEPVATITALKPNLAVELYVNPMDLPLLSRGKRVRLIFDGWPTIVFSGWPGVSYGTFGGRIAAIDSDISMNGKYRILVAPDPDDHPWPQQLRVGTGSQGFALLKNVPVWYELWREINGFPPDFYQPIEPTTPVKDSKKSTKK